MDLPAPVAAGIRTPDPNQGINSYSAILGLQQQQQQLKIQAAQVYQAQRQAGEMKAGAQLMQDPVGNGLVDQDGNPTPQAYAKIKAVMPTMGDAHYKDMLEAAAGRVNYQRAYFGLQGDVRDRISSRLAGVAADPKATTSDVLTALESTVDDYKGTAAASNVRKLADITRDGLGKVVQRESPGQEGALGDHARQYIMGLSRGGLGNAGITGAGGVAAPQNATMDNGAQIQPGTVAPALQGGGFTPNGPATQKQVGPQVGVLTDANGRQFRYNAQSNRLEPVGAGTGSGGGGNAPMHFTQPIPGQEAAQKEIEDTRKADSDYGVNRHINDQILRLSKDTATGPGTEVWHHALGYIAGPVGGNNVADYQKISAYLDRQAALSTRQMGLPETNAGLQTAAGLSGTTGYQPDALQTKVKLTDALVEGAHQYRQGLDRVTGTGPNQDLSKYQAFRQAWASNFDPTVFALDNAHKRGDTDEVKKILSGLSPAQAKELRQKAQNLRLLARGELPQ